MILKFTTQAIMNLRPNTSWELSDENYDTLIWKDKRATAPSKTEVEAEARRLQQEFDNNEYQRARAVTYPSIQEQLDMQYWDKVNNTNIWQDTIAAIKAQLPKPGEM